MKKNEISLSFSKKRLTQAVLASTLFISHYGYADTINAVVGAQTMSAQTNPANAITITQTGQIATAVANGILVDTDNSTIAILANNTNAGNKAIVTSLPGGLNGIAIGSGGKGVATVIGIGSNANIDSSTTQNGIFVNAANAVIDNAGGITGNVNAGIEIGVSGSSTTLINEATGSILGAGVGNALLVGGPSLTFTNAGNVAGAAGIDSIKLNSSFTQITNQSTGTIVSDANAINIQGAGPAAGNISNSGTITTRGGSGVAGVLIGNTYLGTLVNNAGATIQATDAAALGGSAILIKAPFNLINNQGTLKSSTGSTIAVTAPSSGTINNSGIIQSGSFAGANTANTISLSNGITSITNTGTITAVNPLNAVIYAALNNVSIPGGITNSGIINNQAAGKAIDLQSAGNNIDAKLTQSGGTIAGSVYLASKGGSVFDMTGGVINGTVNAGLVNANTLNVSGGTISNTLTLGNAGDTLNLSGGSLQAIVGGAGADTINASGGTFTSLDGKGGIDTLNVNSNVTTAGTINSIENINVNNSGTVFTVNNPITGLDNLLKIASGTTMNVNAAVSGLGALQNTGSLVIASNQAVTLAGAATNTGIVNIASGGLLDVFSYTQSPPGNYTVGIANNVSGEIFTRSGGVAANLQNNTSISPVLSAGQFIATGDTFDIITSKTIGGTITDNSTLTQPNSIILRFDKAVVPGPTGDILRLTVNRNSFSSFAPLPPINGVAGALDQIAAQGTTNPDLLNLLGQLDFVTSQQDLQAALNMLIPSVNYGMVQASMTAVDNAFESMQRRIEDMHGLHYIWEKRATGYNYGDPCSSRTGCPPLRVPDCTTGNCRENCYPNLEPIPEQEAPALKGGSSWGAGYGYIIKQNDRDQYDGYHLKGAGFGFGSDYNITDWSTVGLALHYTQGRAESDTIPQEQKVHSYQVSAYWWYEPMDKVYLDGIFAGASHSYRTSRDINVGTFTTSANGKFRGFQYGGQAELGYLLASEGYFVVPIARLRYTILDVNSYTETDAGGVGLSVSGDDFKEFVGAVGVRLAFKKDFADATYVPEAQILVGYDFINDGQNVVSNFIGGGPTFIAEGIDPPRTRYSLGLGVNVHTADSYVFKVKWTIEERDQYLSNTGFVQLWYLFNQF